MKEAYNTSNSANFKTYSTKFLEIIALSDQILASTEEFMLGTWIDDARTMIENGDDWTKDLFEFNARALLSTWAGYRGTSLIDYSNRKWSGLTASYYYPRWQAWIANRQAEIDGVAKNAKYAEIESKGWFKYGWKWAILKSSENDYFPYTADYANLKANAQLVFDKYSVTAIESGGALAADKVNVALDKKVTTSSTPATGSTVDVTDGDKGTAFVVNDTNTHEFVIDLEKTYTVEEITLAVSQGAGTYPFTYTFAGLEDGNWVEIASGSEVVSNTSYKVNKNISQI